MAVSLYPLSVGPSPLSIHGLSPVSVSVSSQTNEWATPAQGAQRGPIRRSRAGRPGSHQGGGGERGEEGPETRALTNFGKRSVIN